MNRRRLLLDLALVAWMAIGSFIYLRQFAAPGMAFLARLLGHR